KRNPSTRPGSAPGRSAWTHSRGRPWASLLQNMRICPMAVVVKLRRVDGPLSSDEIDDNFQNLAEAVDAVADLAAEGIQIQSIATTTDGAAFVFTMTDGATFGPFTIPGAGLRPMGDWSTGLDYRRQDVAL